MAGQMDTPFDGRGRASVRDMCAVGAGQRFVAIGCQVVMRPGVLPDGFATAGGPIAQAADHDSAAWIARRCDLFAAMLEMLRSHARSRQDRLEVAGLTAQEIAAIMAPLRALIARAEGR